MEKNRQGSLVSETHRECTRCREIYEITNKMTICKQCNSARVKANTAEYKMCARAKNRAAASGYPFDLTPSDIEIPELCPVLGVELEVHKGHPGAFSTSPSLDKIVPELGYVKGNIQVMSQLANQMKGAATPEQLLLFADWIYKTYGAQRAQPNDLC